MRVIAGNLRGRKLTTIRGMAIRPTADRIRESLFNILSTTPRGATVLDLFAGSGAMGIEALSRGARQAVFVEQAAAALAVIRKNIQLCRLEQNSRVIQWDIVGNLRCLQAFANTFDLIFIDPPYNRGMIVPTLTHLAGQQLPAPDAVAVVEHDPAEALDPLPQAWTLTDQRRYGRTLISFLRYLSKAEE
ncbi:MAG: 16S rRNA (guanine(966)-N(2))-methyltransferase RsmD [Desulfobacteraceae bacterium]|nr:16S rRNA (guanine(966)-N(2))-methyltransferase RsmD [Desulfobacteraceae bacterium]